MIHNSNYKIPPSVSIPNQINPIHAPQSSFFKIYFNIIILSTLSFSKWIFPSGFPSKHPVHSTFLPHTCTCPAYLILLHLNTRTVKMLWKRIKRSTDRDRQTDVTSKKYETGRYLESLWLCMCLTGFHKPRIPCTVNSYCGETINKRLSPPSRHTLSKRDMW